jgi:cation transport ATPase
MSDVQYPCPECAAILRPKNPLAGGQKVKCPKCETVFVPVPKPARAAEEEGVYGFVEETAAQKEEDVKIKKKSLEPTLDRRPKSVRGPAQATCTTPSNRMLATSSALCASCLISVIVLLWPMIFTGRKFPGDEVAWRWFKIAIIVLAFAYNALIVYGSVNMQNVESYAWAMMAAALMVFPAQYALGVFALDWFFLLIEAIFDLSTAIFFMLALSGWLIFVGVNNIMTLRMPEVVAGFAEPRPTN